MPQSPQDAQVDSSTTDTTITEGQETQSMEGAQDSSSQSNITPIPSTQQQVAKEGAALPGKEPPAENIYGEVRRKLDEIPNIVQQAVMGIMQQNQQPYSQAPSRQPQTTESQYRGFTKAQLESIMFHPEATEQDRGFATRGLAVLEAKEEALKELRSTQERTEGQSRQAQALNSIVQDYPQLYNSQYGTWNYQDPLFQKAMQLYSSDSRLQGFGNEGLRVAVDRAYANMAREGQIELKKKQVQITSKERQVQKAQSQAIVAGNNASPGEAPKQSTMNKLMTEYAKTPEDSPLKRELRTKIFKAKGLIPPLD